MKSTIDEILKTIFYNKTYCLECQKYIITTTDTTEKDGFTFCNSCGNVFPVENQMKWN